MSLSDSIFLIEIKIKEFISFVKCKQFQIQCAFSDVFTLHIKDSRISQKQTLKEQKKLTRKSTVRSITNQKFPKPKFQYGQSILISCDVKHLISKMENFPLVLYLQKKSNPDEVFKSIEFVWDESYINYLKKFDLNRELLSAVTTTKEYTVFNDRTSQRIASFKTCVKLSIIRNESSIKFNTTSISNIPLFRCSRHNMKSSKDTSQKNSITKFIRLANENELFFTEHKLNEAVFPTKKSQETLLKKSKFIKTKELNKRNILNSLVKSSTEVNKNKYLNVVRSKSNSAIERSKHFNILNYIFGGGIGPFGKQEYCVGYFTVEADKNTDQLSNNKSNDVGNISSTQSFSPLNLPEGSAHITKCKQVHCAHRKHRELSTPQEHQVLLDLDNLNKECCNVTDKIEEVVGGVAAKMKIGKDPCFCTCECTFGFTKKTTYCGVCGGYEKIGEDLTRKPKTELPFPCPIFHKIVDRSKLKTYSTSGSDSKKRDDSIGPRSIKTGSKSGTSSEKRSVEKKIIGSEKDGKKSTKRKKDDRFKFNYGYKGIPPQIGHSQCMMPCTGKLGTVPKNKGWLWTAGNVPGVKYHPQWKPGAVSKFVHRLLKIAKNPGQVIAKKKRKDTGKKKRPLKRPLLVVHKKGGEYTVTMETMKNYSKLRQLNQPPYEDKPAMVYTIGRTEEENRARQKKKEREQRRLERAQRHYIQSAFQDMCHEICLKTYRQALGILPDTEDPKCPCYPLEPSPDKTNMNVSCSCSEVSSFLGSETDSDEWIVEFTPPNATFNPSFKSKKLFKVDNSSQYTYLDFRVKLVDRYGKPVPRFFKGPDGKQQCSDLGGFWSPDHKWLEINIDGYIAPDGRWAPNIFTGPNGETVDSEMGKFQVSNNKWLVVGVDGFVDGQGRWHFYPKPKSIMTKKMQHRSDAERRGGIKHVKEHNLNKTLSTWSCFGDVNPEQLSTMGIVGHGNDRKLLIKKLEEMIAQGKTVNIPQPVTTPAFHTTKKRKNPRTQSSLTSATLGKCSHPVPSDKGIEAVDAYGNKTYFRLKKYRNKRPRQRMANLLKQGISLSSFHAPCFHSFISSEIMKKQLREKLARAYATRHGTKDKKN